MQDELTKRLVAGIVRHVLTTAGGALVANGWIEAEQTTQLVGVGMTIFGLLWSMKSKRG